MADEQNGVIDIGGDPVVGESANGCCDLTVDAATLLLEEGISAHQAVMTEGKFDAASAHNIVRHAGARKYNQEDPIEAACAEKILKG